MKSKLSLESEATFTDNFILSFIIQCAVLPFFHLAYFLYCVIEHNSTQLNKQFAFYASSWLQFPWILFTIFLFISIVFLLLTKNPTNRLILSQLNLFARLRGLVKSLCKQHLPATFLLCVMLSFICYRQSLSLVINYHINEIKAVFLIKLC